MLHIIRYILRHPYNQQHKVKAVFRFIYWQMRCRLTKNPIVVPFTAKTKLVVHKGMIGATGNIYCGLHEFHDMAFLLHMLREDDTFIDVGANVGTYSVLASGHVGARTIAIEPNPNTFSFFQRNVNINQLGNLVIGYNIALGSKEGSLQFTNTLDAEDHVARPGDNETLTVSVNTLDALIQKHQIPNLIKIDVEGYETEVIAGSIATLENPNLKAVIIELAGIGAKYGFDEDGIRQKLSELHFKAYQYDAFSRKLIEDAHSGHANTIFVRDFEFVMERLRTAPKVELPQMSI